MSNEYVTVRNLVTRKVGQVRRRVAEHAIHGKVLEIVPEGTKSFVPLADLVKERPPRAVRVKKPKPETEIDTLENNYEKEDEA